MSYQARSPRERSSLRAVLVHGETHSLGAVRDVSASGLFVQAPAPLTAGQRVAVVPLLGDADGVRLAAEVVRVEGSNGVALRFLDPARPLDDAPATSRRTPVWMQREPLAVVPPGAPELLLADEDEGAVPATAMPASEQRRAARIARTLVVSVRGVPAGQRLHATDVGPDGLFVVSDHTPPVGARVHVTLRLPATHLPAIARVTRIVPPGAVNADPGFGLEIIAMADDDYATWCTFVDLAAGPLADMIEGSASVRVRPENVDRLRDFAAWDLAAGGTMLFARELYAPGEGVLVVVVHPVTQAEMALPAVVVNAHTDAPQRMDVVFLQANETLRARFAEFVDRGHVPAPRALPAGRGASTPPAHTHGEATRGGERALSLAAENAALRRRIDELEAELAEAERSERFLFSTLHAAEQKRR